VAWVNSGVVTRRAWLLFGFNDSIGGIHFGHSLLSMKPKVNPTTNQSGLKKHLASNLPIFSDFVVDMLIRTWTQRNGDQPSCKDT
jgi:hypothetical protein